MTMRLITESIIAVHTMMINLFVECMTCVCIYSYCDGLSAVSIGFLTDFVVIQIVA